MGIWEWATAVLAIWGAVSILVGLFWWLAGRRIFRKPPLQPRLDIYGQREASNVTELKRHDGGA